MLEVTRLLLQIGIILLTARAVGWIFRRIHQPLVVGEMVAGILLGPSLLGWLAPSFSLAVFPSASLAPLGLISQVGLVIYMFLVGLDLNPGVLKERTHTAVITSHVSIVIPFLLGVLLAFYLYPRLSYTNVKFSHFSLFLGISMSITAFPVLARILSDRGLSKTSVGAIAITCAAVDDVTAWCLLAALVLFVRSGQVDAQFWYMVGGSIAYIGAMIFLVRPILARLLKWYRKWRGIPEGVNHDILALVFLLVLGSAVVTEAMGIHALFGAFLIGAILPREEGLAKALSEKLEGLTVVLLLPLFFAITGLRTRIGLLSSGEMWVYCAIIVTVAIAGKLGGALLASRFTGMDWRSAGAVGILMNTRGLMELVVLNIGLEIGVVSPPLFAMLVIMAIVTTFMTTPLLDVFYLRGRNEVAGRFGGFLNS